MTTQKSLKKAEKFYHLSPETTDRVILSRLKENDKLVVHGGKALNAHLPAWLDKVTEDWDIFSDTPRATAKKLEEVLEKKYGGNYFTVKPAKHKGTFRIKAIVTKRVVADITLPEREIEYKEVDGVNYATLDYHVKQIKRTLAIPEYSFRHGKDKETLQRIKIYKRRYPRKVKDTRVIMPKVSTVR